MSDLYTQLSSAIRDGKSVATLTLISGEAAGAKLLLWLDGSTQGELGEPALQQRAIADGLALLALGDSRVIEYAELGASVFIESFVPPPTLFMIGGVHIAIALSSLSKVLGFRTVVIDA